MAELNQIKYVRPTVAMGSVYEKLLDALDSENFGPTVLESLNEITAGVRRLYLFEATSKVENQLQYYFCEPYVVDLFPAYKKWYLPEDPISEAYQAAPACSDMVLQRIRPGDINCSQFRQHFFDAGGIVERISIVQKAEHAWRGMSVARHKSHGCCSDEEITALLELACLALPIMSRNALHRQRQDNMSIIELEERFASRYSRLTSRERQVCARAVIGMTVEATAKDLGIARTSVLTYRQRAYQRLNVSSPLELCSLFVH